MFVLLKPAFAGNSNLYDVVGCNIYTTDGSLLRSFYGNYCLFFDDGSYVASYNEGIHFFSERNEEIRSISISSDHLLNFDLDKNFFLVQSHESIRAYSGLTFFEKFFRIDRGLKVDRSFFIFDHLFELITFASIKVPSYYAVESNSHKIFGEFAHANSIYPIPKNKLSEDIAAFQEGNYILGLNLLGIAIIVNSQMNKILWVQKIGSSFHDIQILPSGEMIYYLNYNENSKNTFIQSMNPVSGIINWSLKVDPNMDIRGGVQYLGLGKYLFNSVKFEEGAGKEDKVIGLVLEASPIVGLMSSHQLDLGFTPFLSVKRENLFLFLKNNR